MKKLLFVLLFSLAAGASALAQDTTDSKPTQPKTITISESQRTPSPAAKPTEKRPPVFRPTKDQIKQVQALLKERSLYNGEATGTYNDDTRTGIRGFQKTNGLKETGTLNRATLEKMGIELTDTQKAIPVSENSFAPADPAKSTADAKPKAPTDETSKKTAVFRATSDQVKEAQKILKAKSFYSGEETGKLDDATRAGLKKYQEANKIKVTGTLNQATLDAMGIALTEKQKGTDAAKK